MVAYYKYIHFIKKPGKHKTEVWACKSNKTNDLLATVKWYGPWRGYSVHFDIAELGFAPGTVFNSQCLKDLDNFLQILNKKHKREADDGKI